jgi:hypothetical protein
VVQAAIGGQEGTRVYEGEITRPLTVRLAAQVSRQRRRHPLDPDRGAEQRRQGRTAYIALSDVAE